MCATLLATEALKGENVDGLTGLRSERNQLQTRKECAYSSIRGKHGPPPNEVELETRMTKTLALVMPLMRDTPLIRPHLFVVRCVNCNNAGDPP